MPSREEVFQLVSGEVHCWSVSLCASPETRARLHANLACDDHARGARLRFARDRRRFDVAHGMVRELLGRYLQVDPGRVRYTYNAFGKPELSPGFGDSIKFNLSHSADLALIAVAAGSEVGVDLEQVRGDVDYMEIARRFFPAADADLIEALPGRFRPEAFFRCWTRTEACWKACGRGLAHLDGASGSTLPAGRWSLFTLRPAPGYVGAVAMEGKGRRLTARRWEEFVRAFP